MPRKVGASRATDGESTDEAGDEEWLPNGESFKPIFGAAPPPPAAAAAAAAIRIAPSEASLLAGAEGESQNKLPKSSGSLSDGRSPKAVSGDSFSLSSPARSGVSRSMASAMFDLLFRLTGDPVDDDPAELCTAGADYERNVY